MAINVTISTGGQTTAVTIPEVKNTVQVTGGNITQAERDKLAGIPSDATGDQTLTAGDLNIVIENGPDYEISLASTIRPTSVLATTLSASQGVSAATLSASGNISSTGGVVRTNKIQPYSNNGISDLFIRAGGGISPKSVYIVESANSTERFQFSTSDSKFTVIPPDPNGAKFFSLPTSSDRSDGTAAQTGDLITFNASNNSTSFEAPPDISQLLNVGDVSTGQSAATTPLQLFDNALVYSDLNDGNGERWVAFKDAFDYMDSQAPPVGSPPPLQQFVNENLVSTNGSPAPGLYTANGVLSVNQSSTIPSSLNFYVNGDARVNGAIQVGDTSGVTYAFPTTDGTANQVLATDGSGAVTFVTPSTSNVTEGTNLYYTDSRVAANSAVAANTAKVSYPTADSTKVAFISVTQAVDLDTMESDIATNNAKVGYTDSAVDTRIAAASIDDLSDVDTSTVAPTDGQALVWDNTASKWEPGTVSGGSSVWTTSGSDIYYNTGNVGIGTTTPSEPLHVEGDLLVSGSTGTILQNRGKTGDLNDILITSTDANYTAKSIHSSVRIGQDAGRSFNSSNQKIIAIGTQSLQSSSSSGYTIAIGFRAAKFMNGLYNVTIGNFAGSQASSSTANSVFIGENSGRNTSNSNDHVIMGRDAGYYVTTGAANTMLSRDAGKGANGTPTFSHPDTVG